MLMGGVYVCPCTGPCTKVQRSLQPAVLSAVKCSMTEAIWAVTSRYTVTARNTDVRIVRKDSINGSRTTCICVYIQVRYICISFTKEYLNLSCKLSYISEECQKQFVYLLENLQTLTPPPRRQESTLLKTSFLKYLQNWLLAVCWFVAKQTCRNMLYDWAGNTSEFQCEKCCVSCIHWYFIETICIRQLVIEIFSLITLIIRNL